MSGSRGLGQAAGASEIAYEANVRSDALPAGAVQAPRPASESDLQAWRYATQQSHAVLWGPVPAAEAARIAGAPAGCESVLIAPAVPFTLLRDVEDLIPSSVKPLPTDTAEKLAARLGESDFLDDILIRGAAAKCGVEELATTGAPRFACAAALRRSLRRKTPPRRRGAPGGKRPRRP